jgi:DNA repair protein RadC
MNKLSITKWAEEDRPREKLFNNGPASLTTAELIAILLGSGNANESAVDLAKRIFNDFSNDLTILFKAPINDLKKFNGIGEAKAITMAAAFELARRYNASTEGKTPEKVNSSLDAYRIIAPNLLGIAHEEFWVISISNANVFIAKHKIGQGGITSTYVDLRILFKKVLTDNASSIIICHNHPSGSDLISNYDKALTTRIKKAAETLDIRLFDHIVIAGNKFISFADENFL